MTTSGKVAMYADMVVTQTGSQAVIYQPALTYLPEYNKGATGEKRSVDIVKVSVICVDVASTVEKLNMQ